MKKFHVLFAFLLIAAMLLSSCSIFENLGGGGQKPQILPFPENAFAAAKKQGVIGSITQTGDGNAYVMGTVPAPQSKIVSLSLTSKIEKTAETNKHLVTFEHNLKGPYVSGYIGSELYIIQGHGSLAWNKKGIGHKDGTILLEYDENGYFSISSLCENKVIVGNPTDESVESLWDSTESYMFGYMVYDPETKSFAPMYEENNLRFYTAGYFMGGVAMVSVKEDDKILFGVIDAEGNYVVEPQYEMMADESIDNVVIVALEAEPSSKWGYAPDNCVRLIGYDNTLMTNVQGTRVYACLSQSVGLINTLTGEDILPCSYAYIERVMDDTYFVIDNEGAGFLYDISEGSFTAVEKGAYSYFNSEWMLYVESDDIAYLADKDLNLYELTGLDATHRIRETSLCTQNRINTNIVSAIRDEEAKSAIIGTVDHGEIGKDYNFETRLYTITVPATGDVLENISDCTNPYNGAFFYAKDNALYRYEFETGASTRIETGYGNFTEDYSGSEVTRHYCIFIEPLNEDIYVLDYRTEWEDKCAHFRIIINDKGDVLFSSNINSVEPLCKNYLGRYDDALYSLIGSTEIEDNYYLTRDDGAHFLFQVVRGEADDNEEEQESDRRYSRRFDNFATFSLLSPFMLDFADGSEITVTVGDTVIASDCYVYDSEAQSLKLFTKMFENDIDLYHWITANHPLEILVTAGEETVTLKIELSQFADDF